MSVMEGEGHPLEARVCRTLAEQEMIRPGETALAAVSGGADSVALLLLLSRAGVRLGFQLEAAHYEHGIRGEASREDARYVAALCAEYDIPFHLGEGDVPALAAQWRCSMEDAARRARYAFFDETAARIGAERIALAHQREDQAETLLLHLAHGAGLRGMSGMRPVQGNRIRPLLDISRMELEGYLREKGVAWREDETNRDMAYTRNRLRHEAFPILREINPRVAEAMARSAAIAAEAEDALDAHAADALAGHTKRLPYGAFWEMRQEAMNRWALRRFLREAGVPEAEAAQCERILALAPGETGNLPGGWRALRTKERLHLLSPTPERPMLAEDVFRKETAQPGETGDGIRTQVLDADALEGAAFRFRRDGDVFAPLGMQGTQKLKRTLQDAGIDRPFRDLLPVLAAENRILWIVGLKPGRDAAITAKTRRAVRIAYTGDIPWELPTR